MPYGKGTYGSQIGRPPMTKRKNLAIKNKKKKNK